MSPRPALAGSDRAGSTPFQVSCLLAVVATALLSELNVGALPGAVGVAVNLSFLGLVAVLAAMSLNQVVPALADPHARASRRLVALLCIGVAGAGWSLDPSESLVKSIVAVSIVLAITGVTLSSGFDRAIEAVAIGIVGVVIVSVLWELIGPGTPIDPATGVHDTGFGGLPRLQGLTEHPNQLGRTAGMLVILGLTLKRRTRGARTTRAASICAGFVGLAMSQSRTSILAVVVAFLVFRLIDRKFFLPAVIGTGVIGAVGVAWLAGVSFLDLTTRNGSSAEILTATGRSRIWAGAWRLAWEHPFTGSGAFVNQARMQFAMDTGEVGTDAVDPHNLALLLFLSYGLVGVFLFGSFVVEVFRRKPQHAASHTSRRVLGGLLLWAGTESLLPGLNTNLMIVGLVAAPALSVGNLGTSTVSPLERARQLLDTRRLVTAAAIILAVIGGWVGHWVARSTAPTIVATQALAIDDVPPHELTSAHHAIAATLEQSRVQLNGITPAVDASWLEPIDTTQPNFAIRATATTTSRAGGTLALTIDDIASIDDLGFALSGPRANLALESDLVGEQLLADGRPEVTSAGSAASRPDLRRPDDVELQEVWASQTRIEVLESRAAAVQATEEALIDQLALRATTIGDPTFSIPSRRAAVGSLLAPALIGSLWATASVSRRRRQWVAGVPVVTLDSANPTALLELGTQLDALPSGALTDSSTAWVAAEADAGVALADWCTEPLPSWLSPSDDAIPTVAAARCGDAIVAVPARDRMAARIAARKAVWELRELGVEPRAVAVVESA